MADEKFGRYSPITSEPVLTAEEIAKRNLARILQKQRDEEELKRRQERLRADALQQAKDKANPDEQDRRRPAPLQRREDGEWRRESTAPEKPTTVTRDNVTIPLEQAVSEIPAKMRLEQRLLSSPLKERALRRNRTEELIGQGKTPDEAAQQAQKEQENRQAAFERGKARAQARDGKGASGFVGKEASDLATDLVYGGAGLISRAVGANQAADEFQAFVEGSHAETADWRNEKSPYPQVQGAVSGAANSLVQMVPGMAASAVAGPGVGMGVMAAQFGGQEYNRAMYEGAEAGIAGDELNRYAMVQGGIEASIMPIMNKIPGLGGLEAKVLRGNIARGIANNPKVRQAIASGVMNFTKETASEVAEEVLTEALHGFAKEGFLDERVDHMAVFKDTVLQTLLTMGLTEGAQRVGGAISDRMSPDAAAGSVTPSTPTPDPATTAAATQAAESVPVDEAAIEILNRPAVQEFLNKPQSARTYEAAVKAGMPPIQNPNRENRARHAEDLRRRLADPVSQPAAQLEPAAVDRQAIESPSGTVPDVNVVDVQNGGSNRGQEIIQNTEEQQVGQEVGYQGTPVNEGRQQEELLTPAESRSVATSEDSRIPPADHTRESFEKEYTENFTQLMELPPDDPKFQALESRMADLYDAHPDWAQNLETTQPVPSVVGQTESGPGQSSPPATGPVSSSEPKTAIARTITESVKDLQPADDDGWITLPKPINALVSREGKAPLSIEVRDYNPQTGEVSAWNPKTRSPYNDIKVDDLIDPEPAENQTSPVSESKPSDSDRKPLEGEAGWRRQPGEPRNLFHDRLKHRGWKKSPKPDISVIDSPDRVLELSRQQLKTDPFKAGDAVTLHTGFAGDDMQTAAEVVEDTGPSKTSVKVRTSKGDLYEANAYYVTRTPKAEQPADSPVPAFLALPQKSQDLFNKAFESKDVEQLKQMVDKSNVAWNKEFERRTGVKLPRTLKDRYRAVMEWANPTPTYGKRSGIPKWGIYQTMFQGKPKFSVKESDNDKGFGDSLHDTAEEAKKYADIGRQRETERAEAAAKRQAAEEADQKKQQDHEASFQGFLTDDPMVKGRRLKTLDSSLNYKNKTTTRKALVEQKVADGWTVNDKDQLQAQTGEFLDERDLTKTGIDYARHLIDLKPVATETPEPAKAETPPADSQPEPSQEDLMEAILRDELLGEKPAKERKPRAPRTGETKERKPRKPRSESAKERSDKTAKALKEAEDEFGASFGATLNAGLTAQQMRAAAKLVRAALDHQVSKFNEFVAYVADRFGDEIALRAAEGIELAWRTLKRLPDYAGIDEAGSVSEFINQRNEAKNATGNDGTTGREEDQGGSQPDSGDTQDATGPADAEVLGSEPAEDGQTAKKPRGSKRIRGSARGSVRQGNADADSGAGDVTERSGDERGATSSDESGAGTGIDKAPNSTRPNYHLTNPEMIIGGGPKAKFARNQKAIALVRDIEEGNRQPTAEEMDTLAGYVGWGAFGQELFNGTWDNPKPKQGWEEEDQWLRMHLGKEEWTSAQESIVNAHFTDPQTVTAMWDMARRMGFKGGRVLEPSMGVGNFFSLMPRDLMEKSALTGIELDKITAKMAKLLHPEANIHQKGYQESQTPDNFYDLIISNVPFANVPVPDRRYKQDFSVHNYFFKKAFDQVKPGGVIAFLTSNMTMDGKTQAKLMRAQIANQGDLVTAIRLPSGAFQTYAGTKVVADLIIIRKRKPGESPSGDQRWIEVNEMSTPAGDDKTIDVNEYWQNHPDHILGQMTWGHGTTSGRPGMIVNKPTDLQAALNDAIRFVPENIINTAKSKAEGRERANTTAQRQNSVLAKDNELWSVKGEHLVPLLDSVAWWRKGSKPETIEKNRKEIESLLDVREALRDVLSKQASSQDATEARAALNRTYDAFVKKYGPIGESAAGTHLRKAGDPLGNTLLALEKREQVQGQTKGKGKKPKPVFRYSKRPIFERNTVRQKRNVDNPSLNDAFALERNRSLDIDLERVAEAAKMPLSQVIKTLVDEGRIYKTGNGTYDAADVFLSGNMSRKLRQLEAAQAEGMKDLEKSIEAVRELIPEPVPYSQIEAKLGAPWVSSDDFSNYLGSLLNEPGSAIAIERRVHGWKVTIPTHINNKSEATTLHGHPGIEFSKIASAALNNATVRVTMPDPDDDRKRVTDPEGTAQANAKVSELRENFAVWLWADAERIARLSGVYNEEFNSTVTPKFDDIPLDFEGLVIERGNQPFNLRHHQAAAVWRGIVSGKGIFAHEVGTGKTLTMAALAMESRRLGLYNKPILLAHNANSLAVRNEIQDAYPGANILYVDNLDASRKAATLQAIATEDWDLIVVPHSMAENFMMRPETVEALLKPEMDALEAAALEAFAESEASEYAKGEMPGNLDEISKDDLRALKEPTAKELVKERMKLRAMIVKAQQAMADGDGVFFEDMGVDMVMVDEAHIFKKLPITSKQRIKGLNKNASQMGNMLMMMTDYIRTKNNGRGVYLFTGTPITNTVNEIFNMMRFVMAEEMDASGVRGWDGWFNNFATQETMTELSSGGTWENFDRVASFVNLPELRQMAGRYMDIVFADDMVEFKPRPEREGRSDDPKGRPYKQVNNVIINMLDAQRELSDQLKDRYITFRDAEGKEKVRMMREPGGRFNPLVIEGEGVKLAMDPRLVDYGTKIVDDKVVTDESILDPRNPNLKINKMITNAMTHYNEHPKATQMIFMQVGYTDSVERVVGRNADGTAEKQRFRVFNVAKEIKRRLMEEGVPEDQIAIFSSLSKEKRAEAALKMQDGTIRFAIGSTETMGTGVNAQNELIAMHHLDAPWMPGDLDQRNGRGHRQGNHWNTVNEYRYLTEGPQDGRRWQVLLTKDRFIKEFMRGDSKARSIEMDDVDMSDDGEGTDMEQTFSAAAGDPRIMQRIRLEGQVEKLQRQNDNHARTITDSAKKANELSKSVADREQGIPVLQAMYDTWKSNKTEVPIITLNGKTYEGMKEITDQLQTIKERYEGTVHSAKEIGTYRGLPLVVDNGILYIGPPLGTSSKYNYSAVNTTAYWNLQSLQGIMGNLPERIERNVKQVEKDRQFIDMAKKAVTQQFPKKKQLESKQRRLASLVAEMQANPDVSPAWLRTGAPVGTTVYWKGERYEVAGHRDDDTILYADGDDLKTIPANEATDVDGTRMFPQLPETPADTPDPATQPTEAGSAETEAQRLRQEADQAQQELRQIQAMNEQYNSVIAREWKRSTSATSLGSAPVFSKEMFAAVAGRALGSIRAGAKRFEVMIRELRAEHPEGLIVAMKPNLIAVWNSMRPKFSLEDVATDAAFDTAIAATGDADLQQATEAAIAASTPTPDPETPPAATPDPEPLEPDMVEEPVRSYSLKNAATDAERESLGMPPRRPNSGPKWAETAEFAASLAKTDYGRTQVDNLIADLGTRPRATTPTEHFQLLQRYAEVSEKYKEARDERNAAKRIGDAEQEAISEREMLLYESQKTELVRIESSQVSYLLGAGLAARRASITQDFTIEELILDYESAFGRKLDPENNPKDKGILESMRKRIAELEAGREALRQMVADRDAQINDLETRLKEAHDAAVDAASSAPPVSAAKKRAQEKVSERWKAISALLGKSYSIETALAQGTKAFIDLAGAYVELGVTSLGDYLNRVRKRMGPDAEPLIPQFTEGFKEYMNSVASNGIDEITRKIDLNDDETIGKAARELHRMVIQRDGLTASAEDRERAVTAVHMIMATHVEGITPDQVARAMSGIGVYAELNKDEIEVIRRDQKAQLLLLQQIRDWNAGQAPPATGMERPPISDEQRALRKVVNEAKKAAGIVTATEGQLRSALDAAKRMVRNRISDLNKALEPDGKPIERSKRVSPTDPELDALRAERDDLQKQYDAVFGKNQMSDEQRLAMAEKMMDKAIANLENDLAAGKLYADPKKPPVSSPALEAKREQFDALKASREEMRIQSGESQARSDAAFERHLLARGAELARRIAEKDFAPAPKPEARELTPAMLKQMMANQKMEQEFINQKRDWEFKNRHPIYKAWHNGPVQAMGMIRKGLTTIDQSLIGRQGWLLGITHPLIYGKAIKNAFGSNWVKGKSIFPTEQDVFNVEAQLDADAGWVRLEKVAKLAVTGVHGGLRKTEENLSDVPAWFDKIPGIGGSERAGSAFINSQRRMVFRELVTQLARWQGKNAASLSSADLRVIGNLVNVSTGRASLGKLENAAQVATALFFSPRWWASRLQTLVGAPIYSESRWLGGEGASTDVRLLVAKEWAKQMAAQTAIMTLVVSALAAAFGDPGDDEEWDWYANPSNPNFGRLRIGSTYIDMTSGIGAHVALLGRLVTGKQVDRWETKDIDRWRMFLNYGRTKLAPVPGIVADWMDGQSIGQDPFGSYEWATSKVVPLSIQDVVKTVREEGLPLGAIVSTMMFFGLGAQTREAKTRSRADISNEIRAMRKQGKSPDKIQAALKKHLEYTAKLEAKEKLRTANPDEKASLESVVAGDSQQAMVNAVEKEKYDLTIRALEMLSSEDRTKKKAADEDSSIMTARSLLKEIAPTYSEAQAMFNRAYMAKHGRLTEVVGGRFVPKKGVLAARRRLRAIYAP